MEKVAIIGAGSLGTALAQTIAENVDQVYLHLRREELKESINSKDTILNIILIQN